MCKVRSIERVVYHKYERMNQKQNALLNLHYSRKILIQFEIPKAILSIPSGAFHKENHIHYISLHTKNNWTIDGNEEKTNFSH